MAHGEILGAKQKRSTKPEQINQVDRGYFYRKEMGGWSGQKGGKLKVGPCRVLPPPAVTLHTRRAPNGDDL